MYSYILIYQKLFSRLPGIIAACIVFSGSHIFLGSNNFHEKTVFNLIFSSAFIVPIFIIYFGCGLWILRFVMTAAIFIALYIQYSNLHFFGKLASSSLLALAHENKPHEIVNAITLYYYAPALATSIILSSTL